MKLKNSRTGRLMAVQNPVFFLARERNLAEEAWPGDIIGIPNHGTLRVGDTLTEGADIRVTGLPSFAPEILRRVHIEDPMKQKHLRHALTQLADEGVTRLFKPVNGSDCIIGVVGGLQLDVLQARLQAEYGLATTARRRPLRGGALARRRPRPNSTASATAIPRRWPRTMTASRSSSHATPGTCAPPPRNGLPSASPPPASSIEVQNPICTPVRREQRTVSRRFPQRVQRRHRAENRKPGEDRPHRPGATRFGPSPAIVSSSATAQVLVSGGRWIFSNQSPTSPGLGSSGTGSAGRIDQAARS